MFEVYYVSQPYSIPSSAPNFNTDNIDNTDFYVFIGSRCGFHKSHPKSHFNTPNPPPQTYPTLQTQQPVKQGKSNPPSNQGCLALSKCQATLSNPKQPQASAHTPAQMGTLPASAQLACNGNALAATQPQQAPSKPLYPSRPTTNHPRNCLFVVTIGNMVAWLPKCLLHLV